MVMKSPFGVRHFSHLFASYIVNEGVDIISVSGALGHSTASIIVCELQVGRVYMKSISFS